MTAFKLVAGLRVETNTSLWVTNLNGVPQVPALEIPIPPGLYYILGDTTANDLLDAINDAEVLAGITQIPGVPKIFWSLDTQHRVKGVITAGSITISWGDPNLVGRSSEYLRDWLRFSGTTTSWTFPIPSARTGSRVHVGGLYPSNYLQVDTERLQPLSAQFFPDSGPPSTLTIEARREYKIGVRTTGYPRDNSFNEYHDLFDFYQEASSGRPFRLYSDTLITTAYSTSNRYGYQTMVLRIDPLDPAPEGTWYKHHNITFNAVEY